jgi:hypothetical protein
MIQWNPDLNGGFAKEEYIDRHAERCPGCGRKTLQPCVACAAEEKSKRTLETRREVEQQITRESVTVIQ